MGCVVDKLLTPDEQLRLETAVKPFLRVPSYGCDGNVDSTSFILEASDQNGYRMWHQPSPKNAGLGPVAVVFLELAEWPGVDELRLPPSYVKPTSATSAPDGTE